MAPSRTEYEIGSKHVEGLTTPQLLDALASRIRALADRVRSLSAELESVTRGPAFVSEPAAAEDVHCTFPVLPTLSPDVLRVRMEYAGLTKATFAEVFGLSLEMVHDWLSGVRSIPAWVLPSIHIFELLTPLERRRFTAPPVIRSGKNPAKVHPFARIEEL